MLKKRDVLIIVDLPRCFKINVLNKNTTFNLDMAQPAKGNVLNISRVNLITSIEGDGMKGNTKFKGDGAQNRLR